MSIIGIDLGDIVLQLNEKGCLENALCLTIDGFMDSVLPERLDTSRTSEIGKLPQGLYQSTHRGNQITSPIGAA